MSVKDARSKMRLIVEAAGQVEPETVPLSDAQCVVLGRTPSTPPPALGSLLPQAYSVEERVIPSPSVSGNHVAAWVDDKSRALHLVDLESKNGTWVRLPRGSVVRFSEPTDEVNVRLATYGSDSNNGSFPEPPRYIDHQDFGSSIAQSVRAWLAKNEIVARVWTTPKAHAGEGPTGVTSVPLANGDLLFIHVEHTADVTFHERMSSVSRFISQQNALYSAEESTRSDGMVLASPSMRQIHRRVIEVAMQGLPSLILLGPSGTGKERLAQAYHRHLNRGGPIVAINCATLSRDRMVADLFGAEAGAYTDAKRAMIGAVERADGGTLFLDELGELPPDVQPMLLRFLETGEYQRLGATGKPRFADVHVVAATNRDLRQMVRQGTFREDLFFRLALEIIEVPPLRERFADVEAYLKCRMLGETTALDALTPAALELLRGYNWPGNFREAMNLLRRLPSPARPTSLDEDAVRRALEAGALAPLSPPPFKANTPSAPESWIDWLQRSAEAFSENTGQDGPASWGEMSMFIEQFLKPYALAHLAGVAEAHTLEEVSVNQIADRVKADRGTVIKQLRRYFVSKTTS